MDLSPSLNLLFILLFSLPPEWEEACANLREALHLSPTDPLPSIPRPQPIALTSQSPSLPTPAPNAKRKGTGDVDISKVDGSSENDISKRSKTQNGASVATINNAST